MDKKLLKKKLEGKGFSKASYQSRSISFNDIPNFEIRESLIDQRIIEGYAVIWGSVNSHREKFTRGAFAKSIRELGPSSNSNFKIKFRDEHGRACSLFAELEENEIGLRFKTKPLDPVQWADDVLVQVRSGTINNFSIGFAYVWDKVEYDEANDVIVVNEAKLFEISSVAIPSEMESFAVRSLITEEQLIDDTERFIDELPKSFQLRCRKLFSKYMTLYNSEPHERELALKNKRAVKNKVKLDINFITKNL